MKTSAKVAFVIVAVALLVSRFFLSNEAQQLAWRVVLVCLLILLVKLIYIAFLEARKEVKR